MCRATCLTTSSSCCQRTAGRDGHLRARILVAEGRCLEKLQDAERARLTKQFPTDAAAVTRGVDEWTAAHPAPRATLSEAADHIDHVRKIAGIDHIGLGSDFDGITMVPQGLEDVSKYPALVAELLRRGYKEDECGRLLGENVLRVMHDVEKVSKRLQSERGPSSVIFEAK